MNKAEVGKTESKTNDHIAIEPVCSGETELLLGLYADLFFDREPLTRYFGINKERMIAIARQMHAERENNPVEKGLCWVAKDGSQAGRMAGFIACDDIAADVMPTLPGGLIDEDQKKMNAMMRLLGEIRGPCMDRIAAKGERCLHIVALGVAPGYEGRGIGTRLLKQAITQAARLGFTAAYAECSGPASLKCHEKVGFTNIHSACLNEIQIDGARPYADSDIQVSIAWRKLNALDPNDAEVAQGLEVARCESGWD